jgi:hypothetical protein
MSVVTIAHQLSRSLETGGTGGFGPAADQVRVGQEFAIDGDRVGYAYGDQIGGLARLTTPGSYAVLAARLDEFVSATGGARTRRRCPQQCSASTPRPSGPPRKHSAADARRATHHASRE